MLSKRSRPIVCIAMVALTLAGGTVRAQVSPHEVESIKDTLDARTADGQLECELGLGETARVACLVYQAAAASYPDTDSLEFRRACAIEAMNLVSNLVDHSRHELVLRMTGRAPKSPGLDADLCLERGFGRCGNQATTFVLLMQTLDIPARRVQFYHLRNGQRVGHMAAEVDLDGWRYFDITWGTAFLKDPGDTTSLASVQEVIDGEALAMVRNDARTRAFYERSRTDGMDHLRSNPSIVYGTDSGTVRLHVGDPSSGELSLAKRPRFVGDRVDDGPFEGVAYELSGLVGTFVLHLVPKTVIGCSSGSSQLCVDESCRDIQLNELAFDVENPRRIYVSAHSDTRCSVVFESIHFERGTSSLTDRRP